MDKIVINEEVEMSRQEKEIFRMLRTNIEFSGIHNKVLAITSFGANNGKSTVSFNLACIFAEAGKKVLFIDGDIRNSVLAYRLGIRGANKGLSHFLSGQCELNDSIYMTNRARLYFMPAGIFPINPTELLGSERFEKLVTAVREAFEYVIIDTAPLGQVIDAAVVAKVCDGSILVLEAEHSSRSKVGAVLQQLRLANPNIIGVVINKVKTKGSSGYYGYGYGYGYGSDKTTGQEEVE